MRTLQLRPGLTATLVAALVVLTTQAPRQHHVRRGQPGCHNIHWPHISVMVARDRRWCRACCSWSIAVEDAATTDANVTSVTFNGTALIPVPNSKRSGGGTGIIQTQLFYLLSASLVPPDPAPSSSRCRAQSTASPRVLSHWRA